MAIKKLIAQEFGIDEEEIYAYSPELKYIYLVDPETGKFYEPKVGWEVTGDNLEELFQELSFENITKIST